MKHEFIGWPKREKPHRLPRENYVGEIAVSFTLDVKSGHETFHTAQIVARCVEILKTVCSRHSTRAVYCFMPDHLHLLLIGERPDSDLWAAVRLFKQQSGFWFAKTFPQVQWQKDFFDHIVRDDENLRDAVAYVVANPVVKGMAKEWREYPYNGAIGLDIEDVAG